MAIAAYERCAAWGERVSRFANEAVEVPAYEDRALRGERSPHRLRWRGCWYRVVDVIGFWEDGCRLDRAEYGRAYFHVAVQPGVFFQLYFERNAKGNGRWMLYRQSEIRAMKK
ncbi:MAG: DUF6504 family protein [bacterium]|nr:DUF6504 family protein [bacterium]